MPLSKLVFVNYNAAERAVSVTVDKGAVAHVVRWYAAFHAGDEFHVAEDGARLNVTANGEIIR